MRMVELIRALQLVQSSLQGVRESRGEFLIPLSGQLRALLTDRSRGAAPLLFEIANALRKPASLFCMSGIDDPTFPNLGDSLIMHMSGFPLSPNKQLPSQVEMPFEQFLKEKTVLYKGTKYTPTDIIEWFAHRAGGAHYSYNMPEDFADLLRMNFLGMQPLANALFQIGEATLFTGRALLKSVVDLEIHCVIVVPKQSLENPTYLFDASYEGSPMRLTMFLNNLASPGFFVRGLQGAALTVQSDRLIEWNAPRHIPATVSICDDLSTSAELMVDGERVGVSRSDQPLFVLSDPLDYEYFHNRSVEGPAQSSRLGVGQVLMIGGELSVSQRANLFLYLEQARQRTNLPILAYYPGSYGHAGKGPQI